MTSSSHPFKCALYGNSSIWPSRYCPANLKLYSETILQYGGNHVGFFWFLMFSSFDWFLNIVYFWRVFYLENNAFRSFRPSFHHRLWLEAEDIDVEKKIFSQLCFDDTPCEEILAFVWWVWGFLVLLQMSSRAKGWSMFCWWLFFMCFISKHWFGRLSWSVCGCDGRSHLTSTRVGNTIDGTGKPNSRFQWQLCRNMKCTC